MKINNICCNFNNYMIKNFHLRNYISNMKTYLKFGNLEASNGKIYPNLKNIKKKKKSSGKEVN